MIRFIRKFHKAITVIFMQAFLINIFSPVVSFAITGHSSMPEYRSFEPVSTTNMVNPLTGDFTYNIPLMNVPNGYPLTLSYHSSDVTPESQATWVGLGWTLNPGAINRTKRGFPDEYNSTPVKYHSKMPDNWTLTMGGGGSAEAFGFGASLTASLRYNNYKGFGRILSGSVGYAGMVSLGFAYEAGRIKFNPSINPMAIAKAVIRGVSKKKTNTDQIDKTDEEKKAEEQEGKTIEEQMRDNLKTIAADRKEKNGASVKKFLGSSALSMSNVSTTSIPATGISTTTPKFTAYAFDVRFETGVNLPPLAIDGSVLGTGAFVIQKYKDFNEINTYGYFNLEHRTDGGLADYYSEIENAFEKKDRYLGIPFANYDLFHLTGEAMGGSFRGFRADFGHFYPERTLSSTTNGNIGADIGAPSFVTIPTGVLDVVATGGSNVGGGYGEIRTGDWDISFRGNTNNLRFKGDADFKTTTNEKIIFRFASDKAGSISRTETDNLVRGFLSNKGRNSSVSLASNAVPADIVDRVSRSSYVSMHYDQDFQKKSNEIRYDVFQKELFVLKTDGIWHDYNDSRSGSGIGEIASYNNDGVRYVYGLPLKTRMEKEIKVGLPSVDRILDASGLIATTSLGTESNSKFKTGFEADAAYASQFLLTQITAPDYVDRTMNGLTTDDFGAYTRFNYAKTSPDNDWYKYRTPFQGLDFSYGSLSTEDDDMGGYSGGEKELYYLQSVSSKTHVAFFVTSDREDGKGVSQLNVVGGGTGGVLKKLDKIELYAIADCDEIEGKGVYTPKTGLKPIQTVYFEYDYSLAKNIPNGTSSGGKLSLKKIWFEYEGRVKSKTTPYKFSYYYPVTGTYPTKYSDLQMAIASNQNAQNPDYNILDSDGWGNYRNFALMQNPSRMGDLARFFPFVDQQENATSFDPAAWCLKGITLPSGGEIHVQYEQHDYQYVQDQRAMFMVPLHSETHKHENDFKDKPYYIDLGKAGVNTTGMTDSELMTLAHQLFEPMTRDKKDNRLYFNFLYSLIGQDDPNYTRSYSDYIEGYARIAGYGVHNEKIYFYFWQKPGFASSPNLQEINLGRGHTKWEMPRKACQDFYKANRQGKISDAPNNMGTGDVNAGSVANLFSKARQALGLTQTCMKMDPGMSYVRLQLPNMKAKKGGGVRVKRILMYDKGLDQTNDNVLYGQEYSYKLLDGMSSGVTPNEPGNIRRENPLVNPLDRHSQTKFEALLYGEDMYDNEGPIGSSLLPAPMVSYSRVEITNIHQGATADGYQVFEYYTCKDFPFQARYSTIDKQHEVPLGGGYLSGPYQRVAPHVTQGYVFVINDMHGKIKRMAKYPAGSNVPVFEELYEYTNIGEPVRVMDENKRVSWEVLGKESEMYAERKEVNEYNTGMNTSVDITGGVLIAIVPPVTVGIPSIYLSSLSGSGFLSEQILRSHVTNKVVSYSVIPKKTTTISEGIVHVTENLVYDKYTGNPVITRSMDDFKKTYTNQTFMASWDYPNFQSKAVNERLYIQALISLDNGNYYLQFDANNGGCDALNKFVLGDFLAIRPLGSEASPPPPALYHVAEIDKVNLRIRLLQSGLQGSGNIDLATLVSQSAGVTILRSGRTNQLSTPSGSILAYNRSGIFDNTVPEVNQDITDFIALLNLAHASGNEATILPSLLPADLKLIDPISGECINGKDFNLNINLKKENGKTLIGINRSSETRLDESESLPSFDNFTEEWGFTYVEPGPLQKVTHKTFDCNLSRCFELNYTVNFGSVNDLGGDGVIIVFHNETGNNGPFCDANVEAYCNRGVFGLSSSNVSQYFGIEFDTYMDGLHVNDIAVNPSTQNTVYCNPLIPPFGVQAAESCSSIDFDHINVFKNSLTNSIPVGSMPVAMTPNSGSMTGSVNVEDGLDHNIKIQWNANTKELKVYFDDLLRKKIVYDIANEVFDGLTDVKFSIGVAQSAYHVHPSWNYSMSSTILKNDLSHYLYCDSITDIIPGDPICSSVLTGTTGTFSYNEETGYIQYTVSGQCAQNVYCLSICESEAEPQVLGGIISASAQTFSHEWTYDASKYPILENSTLLAGMNAYETGALGKWRMKDQYVYRTAIKEGRNHAAGEMKDFTLFNWQHPEVNDYNKWLLNTTVTQYSPNGTVIEDKNILDVHSTALYGYRNTLPIAVAQNCKAGHILYESFENDYLYNTDKHYLEDAYEIPASFVSRLVTEKAHTGKRSFRMAPNTDYALGKTKLLSNTKHTTRLWLTSQYNSDQLKGNVYLKQNGQTVRMKPLSSAGDWTLYEASIVSGTTLNNVEISIRVNQTSVDFGHIYLDDLRSQPEGSEIVCYVYDHAQRLVAVFDDRHYALMYQYNAEGALVRKLKETERGIKTLSETQYNVKGN